MSILNLNIRQHLVKALIFKGQKKFAEDDKKNVDFALAQPNSNGNNSTKTML